MKNRKRLLYGVAEGWERVKVVARVGISGVVEKRAKRIGGVGGVDPEGYKLHMRIEIGTTLASTST